MGWQSVGYTRALVRPFSRSLSAFQEFGVHDYIAFDGASIILLELHSALIALYIFRGIPNMIRYTQHFIYAFNIDIAMR